MKNLQFLSVLAGISLTACSTTHRAHQAAAKSDPETVLVTYHVKPGLEGEFQAVVAQAWVIYRKEGLVFASPHVVVRDTEDGGSTRFVEIFTWVNHAAPQHAPDTVKTIWNQEHSLCEARGGHGDLEGGEVELLCPAVR